MRDREHRTPLMNAVENDHHDVINLVVKAGGFLNLPSNAIGEMLCRYLNIIFIQNFKAFLNFV